MAAWTMKRFWQEAVAEPCEDGFTIRLDGRGVMTPAKAKLVLPTLGLAEAVAAEWRVQQGLVRPETMPMTRSANSALDTVTPHFDEILGMVAAYGGSDLLCYRATGPQALIDRQAAGWDPLLDWAAEALGAPLVVTSGVVPVAQPEDSLARLTAAIAARSPFQLAALHDLVGISGSAVLGLATATGRLSPEKAWTLSRLDETWQAELWGEDDEALKSEAVRREALLHAARFYGLCG